MKLTRGDFKLIECEGPGDDYEYLVSKRIYFLDLIRTNKFILLMQYGDAPEYFKSEQLAEEYIQRTFLDGN